MKSFTTVRTRFAPSPTGFLHLGGARTALFSWALARHYHGSFILRIEDTDSKRLSEKSYQSILEGLNWLNLQPDEGPFYQTNRLDRYRDIIKKMLKNGTAYHCYCSSEEIESMRKEANVSGLKPRYNGIWRPEPGKKLPIIPTGHKSVIRFKNPNYGITSWQDMVKGSISFKNNELDDLVIARENGMPTYNFCSAIDDWDMNITHVLRGDDHINNTPRQINILRAINAPIPQYGHIPMIFGLSGEKLSKRHGATDIMDYKAKGYLPDAMINYLARLGWSHGNDEIFSREQFVDWFSIQHLSKSAAQWDQKKFNWVNFQYIKNLKNSSLTELTIPYILKKKHNADLTNISNTIELFRYRASTLEELADNLMIFYEDFKSIAEEIEEKYLNIKVINALIDFTNRAKKINWTLPCIAKLIEIIKVEHKLETSKFTVPLRILLTGRIQTPPINSILFLLGRSTALSRLDRYLLKNKFIEYK